jgi:hypothetical protein
MKVGLGKVPFSAGASVSRHMSQAARDLLDPNRAAPDQSLLRGNASSSAGVGLLPPFLPVGGGLQAFEFYSAEVYLGTPPQPVVLLLDTGSSDLGVNLVR